MENKINIDRLIIREGRLDDIDSIVDVHVAAFPDFFLTTLGSKFLGVMYRIFLSSSENAFVVCEMDGRLAGFAVGLMKSSGADFRLAFRFLPELVLALMPSLLRHPLHLGRRIFSRLIKDEGRISIPRDALILRSLGVNPEMRRNGVARRLLGAVEEIAKNKNAKSIALTTDAVQNEHAVQFYVTQGYQELGRFKQDNLREMLIMIKYLPVL